MNLDTKIAVGYVIYCLGLFYCLIVTGLFGWHFIAMTKAEMLWQIPSLVLCGIGGYILYHYQYFRIPWKRLEVVESDTYDDYKDSTEEEGG